MKLITRKYNYHQLLFCAAYHYIIPLPASKENFYLFMLEETSKCTAMYTAV